MLCGKDLYRFKGELVANIFATSHCSMILLVYKILRSLDDALFDVLCGSYLHCTSVQNMEAKRLTNWCLFLVFMQMVPCNEYLELYDSSGRLHIAIV